MNYSDFRRSISALSMICNHLFFKRTYGRRTPLKYIIKNNIIYNTTLIMLIIILLAISPQIRADTNQQDLLNAIYDMRNATISQMTSGYGIAEEQADNFQLGIHQLIPLHRIEFYFSGSTSLWREYDSNDPKKLVSCTLVKNGIRIVYFIYPPPRGSGVWIEAIPPSSSMHGFSILDQVPVIWSYDYLTRIPNLFWDAKSAFSAMKQISYVKCIRNNNMIVINVDVPHNLLQTSSDIQNMEVKFDTSRGGMLVYYQMINDFTHDIYKFGQTCVLNMTWQNAGDTWVPLTRNVDIQYVENSKYAGYCRAQVDFSKFIVGPVSPEEFSIASMRIPIGTLVTDQIHLDRYQYSPDQDQRILNGGEATPPAVRADK